MARRTVKEVSDDLDKLSEKCADVRRDIYTLEMKLALLTQKTASVEEGLAGVLSTFTWAWRTLVGLSMAAIVAFIISGGLAV